MTERQIVEINDEIYRVEITYSKPDDSAVYRFRKILNNVTYTTSRDVCNCPSFHYGGHKCKHTKQAAKLDHERLMQHLDALGRTFVSNFPPFDRKVME